MTSWLQGGRLASATDFAALNLPAIENWLSRNLPSVAGPFSFRLIAGGFSNLTFRIESLTRKLEPLVVTRPFADGWPAGSAWTFPSLGEHEVKGWPQPVEVCGVRGVA